MTRDYRKRAQPEEKPKPAAPPAWVPFFYGFLLGALVVGVSWVIFTPAGTPLVVPDYLVSEEDHKPADSAAETDNESEPQRPRFDFYTILPEMEVVISDEEAQPPPVDDGPAKIENDVRYRLQVGSFKRMTDADRQKARLALLGVEAEIQKVNIGQGDVYFRVLTQAFESKRELNNKRKLFQKNKINSLVVQVRN